MSIDSRINELKLKLKMGGEEYESRYSYWARLMPPEILIGIEKLKNKKVSELSQEEHLLLFKCRTILDYASLQSKYDKGTITKEELLRYLEIRLGYPLEYLIESKLSYADFLEAKSLMETPNILEILKSKETLTPPERLVKEEIEDYGIKGLERTINNTLRYNFKK